MEKPTGKKKHEMEKQGKNARGETICHGLETKLKLMNKTKKRCRWFPPWQKTY